MPILFEYGDSTTVNYPQQLKLMLDEVWCNRFNSDESSEQISSQQRFVQFDGNRIRARNYSGFVQHDGELIEIFPKVFRNEPDIDRSLMLDHIFYWLSYCRRWKFPFTFSNMDKRDTDSIPELIINLMAKQIYSTISLTPLSQYHPIEEVLMIPKGSINMSRYINNSLTRGNYHLIECDHEPFSFDNKVNRIIKYCSRLLLNATKLPENVKLLQEVIYILDEVDDQPCTVNDIRSTSLNRYYEDYETVLQNCEMILEQNIYQTGSYDLSQWCLLLPMEVIFEDFLAGFLETHFSDAWKIEYQKSNMYFSSEPKAFQMRHDIFITSKINGKSIIIDAKYKMRESSYKDDAKKGINQADMYQVVGYALRRSCEDAILVYPNIESEIHCPDQFRIDSGFISEKSIQITAAELNFWSKGGIRDIEPKLKDQINKLLCVTSA
jgi:5-methylcytosine-specific restriction enzyme subunit McrC